MICEKCGKSNMVGAELCIYCKSKMPQNSGCNGFADILSFTEKDMPASPQPTKKEESKSEGISDGDMQKLLKKSDSIIKSTKKNTIFGFISVVLCLAILCCSVLVGIYTINTVKEYKEETMAEITAIREEIKDSDSVKNKLGEKTATVIDLINK